MTEHDQTTRADHRMERSYEVSATPEQVWAAIATADGLSAWMVPTRLEPRVGGSVSFDLGDMQSTGVVTAYSPNQRFAYEEPWPVSDGQPIPAGMLPWFETIGVPLSEVENDLPALGPVATEFLVESESGGSSVIRVVTSSYGNGADWENEFFAEMVVGWSELLDNLVKHLDGGPTR